MSAGTLPPHSAAALQGGTNELDQELTRRARLQRPRVRHWWGRRSWREAVPAADLVAGHPYDHADPPSAARTGAWCYLCDRPITTWSSRWPVPEVAGARIAEHRNHHIQGRLDAPAPPTEEKP